MITDPIGDLLTRIRNAALNKNAEVSAPYSKMKEAVAVVLKEEGYLNSVQKDGYNLIINLAFARRRPLITGIQNVSKPGLRIYRKFNQLPRPMGGAGISIVSTPKGIMSNREAYKKRLGGEVIGKVW